MKRIISAVLIINILFISGCTKITSDMQSLMKAPKLSAEYIFLQNAIEKNIGKKPDYIYPKTGSYKSAIIFKNVDEDEKEEVLVLYTDKKDKYAKILILKQLYNYEKKENEWKKIALISSGAYDIQSVDFMSFDESNTNFIMVNWQKYNKEETILEIYKKYANSFNSVLNAEYDKMLINDFDSNNEKEILIFKLDNKTMHIMAEVYNYNGTYFSLDSSLLLENQYIKIENIKINEKSNQKSVFVDALIKPGVIATEVVIWDSVMLYSPAINKSKRLYNYIMQLNTSSYYVETGLLTARESMLLCDDYDNDLEIEIPFSSLNVNIAEEEIQLDEAEKIISPLVLYKYNINNAFDFDQVLLINKAARYTLKIEKEYLNNIYGVYNIEKKNFIIKYNDGKTKEIIFEIYPAGNIHGEDLSYNPVREKLTIIILSKNSNLLEKINMGNVDQIERSIKFIS